MSEKVIAQVVLAVPARGARERVTPENVDRLRAPPELLAQARQGLEAEGFTVVQEGATSLSIEGTKEGFERVFGTHLEATETQVDVAGVTRAAVPHYRATTPIRVPPHLAQVVADVLLPTPPDFFA